MRSGSAGDASVTTHDGITLAARDHGGDGPPLVLMHGAGFSHLLSVERLARALADFRVVTFDARWCGQSGDGEVYDWGDLARDVESVSQHFGLDNPVVAGHSWGGMIAAWYGAAHPEATAVVNIDGHGPGDPSRWEGLDPDAVAEFIERTQRMTPLDSAEEGDAEWLAGARPQLAAWFRTTGASEEELDQFVDRCFVDLGGGRWRRRPSPVLSNAIRGDLKLFDLYERVDAPLLIFNCTAPMPMLGPESAPFMEAMRRSTTTILTELADRRSNIRLTVLPEVDHISILAEHAPVVADEIRAFVRDAGRS